MLDYCHECCQSKAYQNLFLSHLLEEQTSMLDNFTHRCVRKKKKYFGPKKKNCQRVKDFNELPKKWLPVFLNLKQNLYLKKKFLLWILKIRSFYI